MTKKKIIEDLLKAGIPTEVVVSNILEKSNWMVYNGPLFNDPEENKQREIDVRAVYIDDSLTDKYKVGLQEEDKNKFISHLIVEVKKSTKPWVFFNNSDYRWPCIPFENWKSKNKKFHELFFEHLKQLGLKSHRYDEIKLHKSHHVAFSDPAKNSTIYEALIKTSKALTFFKDRYGTGKNDVHLFTPVVVLDGPLYSAELIDDNIELKEKNSLFVSFCRLTEDGKFEDDQIIDIVTKQGLESYLKIVSTNNRNLYIAWTNWLKKFK